MVPTLVCKSNIGGNNTIPVGARLAGDGVLEIIALSTDLIAGKPAPTGVFYRTKQQVKS
jgi:hypothetical protein